MFVQTVGIFVGGVLAERHEIGAGLLAYGAFVLGGLHSADSFSALIICFALAGVAMGVTSASRDLLVKKLSPPGAPDLTFRLVYSGFDICFLTGLLVTGVLLDARRADLVLIAVVIVYVATLLAKKAVGDHGSANRAAPVAGR